jgi:hypothetical protein
MTMQRVERMLEAAHQPPIADALSDSVDGSEVGDLAKSLWGHPNLLRVVKAWPDLPTHVKQAILLLLHSAKQHPSE